MEARLPTLAPLRRHALVALLAAVVVAGAGVPAPAHAKPRQWVVTIEAMRFAPAVLEVGAGDTVVWKNKDPLPHNVVADNKSFHSTDIPADGSWTLRHAKAGAYPYACTLHPGMHATIVVKAPK
jgi:plastocyanin